MLELYLFIAVMFQEPAIKIDGSVSLGSILTIVTLIGIALVFHRDYVEMKYEHRLMFAKYCVDTGIEIPEKHRKALARAAGRI